MRHQNAASKYMKEKLTNIETDTPTLPVGDSALSLSTTKRTIPTYQSRVIKHFDPTDLYKTLLQQMWNTHPFMVLATMSPRVLAEGEKARPGPLCSPHHGAFVVTSEPFSLSEWAGRALMKRTLVSNYGRGKMK